jgi:hypothetical protein
MTNDAEQSRRGDVGINLLNSARMSRPRIFARGNAVFNIDGTVYGPADLPVRAERLRRRTSICRLPLVNSTSVSRKFKVPKGQPAYAPLWIRGSSTRAASLASMAPKIQTTLPLVCATVAKIDHQPDERSHPITIVG